jgi:UDP-2,3-diacylglucosamine pyrophosphatase LpxH
MKHLTAFDRAMQAKEDRAAAKEAARQAREDAARGRLAAKLPVPASADIAMLVKAAKRHPDLEQLCDTLSMPPGKVRALIEEAQGKGFQVDLVGGRVGLVPVATGDIILPEVDQAGKEQHLALVGDVHMCSKYHLRAQFEDFCHKAYKRGVRYFLQVGDMLDGAYHHGQFELTHSGFEDQSDYCVQNLPALPGAKWIMIQGNHDETLGDRGSLNVGKALESKFRAAGRKDFACVGSRGANVRIGRKDGRGITVELWHPKKGAGYARTYAMQNHIRDMAPGFKPDILAVGHWHTQAHFEMRGIRAFACGCFQGGGSSFSKSLGGAQSIGSWIIDYRTTPGGTIRDMSTNWIGYYEGETVRDV